MFIQLSPSYKTTDLPIVRSRVSICWVSWSIGGSISRTLANKFFERRGQPQNFQKW